MKNLELDNTFYFVIFVFLIFLIIVCLLVAFIIMVFVRIKCPKNKIGEVLMVLYLTGIVLYLGYLLFVLICEYVFSPMLDSLFKGCY